MCVHPEALSRHTAATTHVSDSYSVTEEVVEYRLPTKAQWVIRNSTFHDSDAAANLDDFRVSE